MATLVYQKLALIHLTYFRDLGVYLEISEDIVKQIVNNSIMGK